MRRDRDGEIIVYRSMWGIFPIIRAERYELARMHGHSIEDAALLAYGNRDARPWVGGHRAPVGTYTAATLHAAGEALAMVLPEPTGLDGWCARLPPSQANMLRVIAEGSGLDKDEVAKCAGVSPTSSGLGAGLRELSDLALIERREGRYYPAEGLL